MAAKPVEVTEATFEQEVLRSEVPVVVDFWAAWCGPCRMIAPIVEELASEYDGRIKFVKVDVDRNPNLAMRYNVMSIPMLAIFRGGQMVGRVIGYMPKAELRRRIEAAAGAAA